MQTHAIVPIRLTPEEGALLNQLKAETGLSKSFILRRCITHTLPQFVNGKLDLLALQKTYKQRVTEKN